MAENKIYSVQLDLIENENLQVPGNLKSFKIEAVDINEAISKLDKYLFKNHLILNKNDFFVQEVSFDDTEAAVSFADSESGLDVNYLIYET